MVVLLSLVVVEPGSQSDALLGARVLSGEAGDLQATVDVALAARSHLDRGAAAASVVHDVLVPALAAMRRRHLDGEIVLPRFLASAEVVRQALSMLEPMLGDGPGVHRGRIVVATLEGDVHHIGKALLVSVLQASGYAVHDLGMQVPVDRIVQAAINARADAVGLSALLLTNTDRMSAVVQELDRHQARVPVLIGGAAITRDLTRRAGQLPDGRTYEPGVFYCRDVFEGLDVLERLKTPLDAVPLPQADVPVPPYWGSQRIDADLQTVWRFLDRNSLYRHHWGGYRAQGDVYERLVHEEFEPLLAKLQAEALHEGWIEARILVGYYPCEAAGDELLIYHPTRPERVVRRLSFPRQPDGERLCLTDYFRAADSGERDLLILQAVSAGSIAGDYVERLQRAGGYRKMLFVNGLASATAEALAEYAVSVARQQLNLASNRGLRFSWGYPACPDIAEQEKILTLLGAAAEIDLTFTTSGSLDPEHSTAAMVVHHPAAKYFAVRP